MQNSGHELSWGHARDHLPFAAQVLQMGSRFVVAPFPRLPACSVLPAVYSQGLMSGQGIAGIIATVAEVIVKAAVPSTTPASQQTSALIYFLFSASTLVACIVTYVMLMRMPFTRYHLARSGAGIDGKARAPAAAAAADSAIARSKSVEIPASRRSLEDAEVGLLGGEANGACATLQLFHAHLCNAFRQTAPIAAALH
jgi:hypothetical protein